MAKVFVFCVGGTGIRVMKSIVMLAASGMKTNGYQIVPIIVDPHVDLEEKTRVGNLIADYSRIYNYSTKNGDNTFDAMDGFFSTRFVTLDELAQHAGVDTIPAVHNSFGDYMNVGHLNNNDINNYLVKTLFSEANLRNSLSVGFKGNPNVGTVVLNDMVEKSNWFQSFLTHFANGDRVFIISSIFGGTGASGYPLIEKKVRDADNFPDVKNAIMGAVTVLPYYSLSDPKATHSSIDSATFYTKTKSALSYYEHSVKSDYLYYVGEQSLSASYTNNEGVQKDSAHFVELVAASALFDFLGRSKPNSMQAMTRAIRDDKDSMDLESLGESYSETVRRIADMMLLNLLVSDLPNERQFPLRRNWQMDDDFYNDEAFKSLASFTSGFDEWYKELVSNRRSFAPLNLVNADGDLTHWIKGKTMDGKDLSYYLLEIIKSSNKVKKIHDNKFRYFVEFLHKAINVYTNKK